MSCLLMNSPTRNSRHSTEHARSLRAAGTRALSECRPCVSECPAAPGALAAFLRKPRGAALRARLADPPISRSPQRFCAASAGRPSDQDFFGTCSQQIMLESSLAMASNFLAFNTTTARRSPPTYGRPGWRDVRRTLGGGTLRAPAQCS